MYVVGFGKSHLKIGAGDIRKSGEKVPEATSWKPHVLQAHLSMNYLMTEDAYKGWRKHADIQDAQTKKRKDKEIQLKQERERSLALAREAEEKDKKSQEEKSEVKVETQVEKEESPSVAEEAPTKSLDELSKSELKKIAKTRDLIVRGSKQELIERIQAADQI